MQLGRGFCPPISSADGCPVPLRAVQDVGERAAWRVLVRGPHPREGDPGCTHHPRGPRVPPLLHSPRAGGPGSTCPAEPVDGRDPACWRRLAVAPVLDFTWVSACLFRLWKRLGLGPACCPPSPAARLLGRGGITGGEGRWGGCKEKGLLSYSLSPNVSQRTGLFCSSPRSPALPAASRHLPAPSSTERRVPPDTSQGTKTPCHGWEWDKKTKEKKQPTLSPSFPPFPETKDCKYCVACLLRPAGPLRPSPAIGPGMGCGVGGREGGKPPASQLEYAGVVGMHPPRRHQ